MITVKVTGGDAVAAYLKRLEGAFTQQNAEADLVEAVDPMVQAVAGNVRTGPPSLHLKENITAGPDREHAKSQGWLAAVAVGARVVPKIGEFFYLAFMEFGTVKQAATPVLRPGYDSTRDTVGRRLVALLAKRVQAAGRS